MGTSGVKGGEPEVEVADVQGFALVGYLAIAEEGADDVDVLAESGDGEGVGDAVLALNLDLMAGPETQDETTVGEVVEAGGGHGDGWGAAYVDADDGCAELYVVGGEGAGGEGGELVAAVALGEPEGVVAELSRRACSTLRLRGVSCPGH